MPKTLALTVALVLAASAPFAATAAAPTDLAGSVVATFQQTCLATRGQGLDAAVTAILAQPGAKEAASLPAYGSGKPMRTFVDDRQFEYLVRPGKGGRYGCFVALGASANAAEGELTEAIRGQLDRLPGLTPKPSKQKQITYYEWSIAGSKDDLRVTPKSSLGSILINLEVMQ